MKNNVVQLSRKFHVYGFTNPKGMEDLEYIPMYRGSNFREAKTIALANENDQFSKILIKEFGVGCLHRWVNPRFNVSRAD